MAVCWISWSLSLGITHVYVCVSDEGINRKYSTSSKEEYNKCFPHKPFCREQYVFRCFLDVCFSRNYLVILLVYFVSYPLLIWLSL